MMEVFGLCSQVGRSVVSQCEKSKVKGHVQCFSLMTPLQMTGSDYTVTTEALPINYIYSALYIYVYIIHDQPYVMYYRTCM